MESISCERQCRAMAATEKDARLPQVKADLEMPQVLLGAQVGRTALLQRSVEPFRSASSHWPTIQERIRP